MTSVTSTRGSLSVTAYRGDAKTLLAFSRYTRSAARIVSTCRWMKSRRYVDISVSRRLFSSDDRWQREVEALPK